MNAPVIPAVPWVRPGLARRAFCVCDSLQGRTRGFWSPRVSRVANVGSIIVRGDNSLVEHGSSVVSYAYRFVEKYGLRFLISKRAEVVGTWIFQTFSMDSGALIYMQYVYVGNVMPRPPPPLDVVREISERFPSSQSLRKNTLEVVMFMQFDKKWALSRPCRWCIHQPRKSCVLRSALPSICFLVTQMGKKGVRLSWKPVDEDLGPVLCDETYLHAFVDALYP